MSLSKGPSKFWGDIKLKCETKQRELLTKKLQAREPIRKFSEIKVGDHLVRKKTINGKELYYHHFLCIGSNGEGRPTIIHYYDTSANQVLRCLKTGLFYFGATLGQLATIQEMTLPHEDFLPSEDQLQAEGAEVERVVWPKELQRYSPEEVVERAKKRKDEQYYHGAKNNCECFVMWCLCDLNISLQAMPFLCDAVGGLITTIFQSLQYAPKFISKTVKALQSVIPESVQAFIHWSLDWIAKGVSFVTPCLQHVLKVTTETVKALQSLIPKDVEALIQRSLGWIAKGLPAEGYFGIALGIFYAAAHIYEAKQKWDGGILVKSREEFLKELVDAFFLLVIRVGGSTLLMTPLNNKVVVDMVGTFLGHLGGKQIFSKYCSEYLASFVEGRICNLEDLIEFMLKKARQLVPSREKSHTQ